ncbi:DUF4296 domain-containing protein [Apibacter raozihei]|uniref:DUF4296 domain-containing protein n=1 Tax=Apibacter TaxID=1778601 RepID=UPI000FE2FDCD|nr:MULTISPECIES: DUF4296 domain-containing protein [Apibacter]
MKQILITLFFLCVLSSCQHALDKPEDLLSKEEMVDIMTDIYLYKQTPAELPLNDEIASDTYIAIFKKYKISKETFQQSFSYYYSNIEDMQHIYDRVIKNLKNKLPSKQLDILNAEEKAESEDKKMKK